MPTGCCNDKRGAQAYIARMSTLPTLQRPRTLEHVVEGTPTSDGAGVRLVRLLTPDLQRRLDPFLMLDLFGSDRPEDYLAGFPEHPHRGFETITLMLEGRMRHRDSAGNEGLLGPGGVQWMIAGRGVIHSEMPEQQEGRMAGYQLWLNLPAADKLRPPWYRDFTADAVPRLDLPGLALRAVAGNALGITGAVQRETTDPLVLDLQLDVGYELALPLPASHNAFVAVSRGSVQIEGSEVPAGRMAILANDPAFDGVRLRAGPQGAQALLVAGRPLNEPIVQHGPFVMNSREQILQAVDDFRRGVLA